MRNKIELPMDEIIKGYKEGMNTTELSEWYGVSTWTIRERLKEARVQITLKKELPMDEIIKGYMEGMTTYELGEKYGISDATISNRLKEAGVRKISRLERNRLKFPLDKIKKEYESGITTRELGEKYGYDARTIAKRLREEGVEIRSRGFGGMSQTKKEDCMQKRQEAYVKKRLQQPIDEIIKDYESGLGCSTLGAWYGYHHNTILKMLREAGVKIRR